MFYTISVHLWDTVRQRGDQIDGTGATLSATPHFVPFEDR